MDPGHVQTFVDGLAAGIEENFLFTNKHRDLAFVRLCYDASMFA